MRFTAGVHSTAQHLLNACSESLIFEVLIKFQAAAVSVYCISIISISLMSFQSLQVECFYFYVTGSDAGGL